MRRIVVFGASSLIGQSLRLCVPPDVEPVWCRRSADLFHRRLNLTGHPVTGPDPRDLFLQHFAPAAIINLAGENRADIVERSDWRYREINVQAPAWLSWWCANHNAHYVHLSSDQVFGGTAPSPLVGSPYVSPPFEAKSNRFPVNRYGAQKLYAEMEVGAAGNSWTIVRPGFLLGVRPMPLVGRENFAERWLSLAAHPAEAATLTEVADRHFSPCFAWDLAQRLWEIAAGEPLQRAVHVALPIRTTRHEIAQRLRTDLEIEAVPMAAERWSLPMALDTSFGDLVTISEFMVGLELERCIDEYVSRQSIDVPQRRREWRIYPGAIDVLALGPASDVACTAAQRDFREAIIARLKAEGVTEVLCLGDSLGDLTIALSRAGIHGIYTGAKNSTETRFAEFRQWMYLGQSTSYYIEGPEPLIPARPGELQAVIALNTVSDEWLAAIHDRLKPDGVLYLQRGVPSNFDSIGNGWWRKRTNES